MTIIPKVYQLAKGALTGQLVEELLYVVLAVPLRQVVEPLGNGVIARCVVAVQIELHVAFAHIVVQRLDAAPHHAMPSFGG